MCGASVVPSLPLCAHERRRAQERLWRKKHDRRTNAPISLSVPLQAAHGDLQPVIWQECSMKKALLTFVLQASSFAARSHNKQRERQSSAHARVQQWIPHRLYRHTHARARALRRSFPPTRVGRSTAASRRKGARASEAVRRTQLGGLNKTFNHQQPEAESEGGGKVITGWGGGGVFIIDPRLRRLLEDSPPCSCEGESRVRKTMKIMKFLWGWRWKGNNHFQHLLFSFLVLLILDVNISYFAESYISFAGISCCYTQQDTSRSSMRTRDIINFSKDVDVPDWQSLGSRFFHPRWRWWGPAGLPVCGGPARNHAWPEDPWSAPCWWSQNCPDRTVNKHVQLI